MINKSLQTFLLVSFLLIFLSYHVNAECHQIYSELSADGNWDNNDTFYAFSGGDITFKLTAMRLCDASTLMIHAITPDGGGNIKPRNFTFNDLNVVKNIAENVITKSVHQFRLQARILDFNNIKCVRPSFNGNLCFISYVPPPIPCDCESYCKKNQAIEIAVPISTAIIGIMGGVGAVLLKQFFNKKKSN
ncbi:hypothetical protein C1645_874310, partial [Glomus cerebriforme]